MSFFQLHSFLSRHLAGIDLTFAISIIAGFYCIIRYALKENERTAKVVAIVKKELLPVIDDRIVEKVGEILKPHNKQIRLLFEMLSKDLSENKKSLRDMNNFLLHMKKD